MYLVRKSTRLIICLAFLSSLSAAADDRVTKVQSETIERPFAELSDEKQKKLDKLLGQWKIANEFQDELTVEFTLWRYDTFAAPCGTHSSKHHGELLISLKRDQFKHDISKSYRYAGTVRGEAKYKPSQERQTLVLDSDALLDFDHRSKSVSMFRKSGDLGSANVRIDMLRLQCLPLTTFLVTVDLNTLKKDFWIRELGTAPDGYRIVEFYRKRKPKSGLLFGFFPLFPDHPRITQIAMDKDTLKTKAIICYGKGMASRFEHYEIESFEESLKEKIAGEIPPDYLINEHKFD